MSLCLIGCLYHVSEISSVYLKYETKIDVTIESSDQIVVPLISFCQPTNYSLKIPFEDGLTPAKLYNYSLGK